MRFVLAFGLCGLTLALLAGRTAREDTGAPALRVVTAAAEAQGALCSLALATVYGLRQAGVNVEDALSGPGRSRAAARVVLWPYRALGGLTLYVLARWFDREGLLNAVAPGLFLGRLPFRSEGRELREAGVQGVVNLCWEFPGPGAVPGIATARVPILDGAPPTDRQFTAVVDQVARWRAEGKAVLIHCAQGHGRSATVTAAVLLRLGLAGDVERALALIRAARPGARPSRGQRAALVRFLSNTAGRGEDASWPAAGAL